MSQISPPIRILLVCAVAFMAAWMLFLRPKSDADAPSASSPTPAATLPVEDGGAPATSMPGKAVEQANEAVAAQDAQAEALANGSAAVTGDAPATPATTGTQPVDAATPAQGAPADTKADAVEGGLPLPVLKALGKQKVVTLLFWNPRAVEDQRVRRSLKGVNRHDGKVYVHAANINKIADYQQITRGADVVQSPTVLVVGGDRKVQSLVGYVAQRTIDQAVTDALRAASK
ncbi:MAG TPA: hypothetical protein VD836_12910 [Solirubrobacteraceae bacterium]|nr:hypothetical protein [Solirubrobacteraceae bacterium]